MKYINQRGSPRIDIGLRCRISSAGLCPGGVMYTENISRSGILISWDPAQSNAALPRLGQLVTVEIELPVYHGFGRKCIHCEGEVVRVSVSGGGVPRVALSVKYMKFCKYRETLAAARTEIAEIGTRTS
jgi:hypothetical protein